MRTKSWTRLCRNSEALAVFERTERAKGDLDPLFVVPADVGIECLSELFDGRGASVPGIEQLRLQPPEEALTCRIVGGGDRTISLLRRGRGGNFRVALAFTTAGTTTLPRSLDLTLLDGRLATSSRPSV